MIPVLQTTAMNATKNTLEPNPETALDRINAAVNVALAEVAHANSRLSRLKEKSVGPEPQSEGGNKPCCSGILGEIADRFDALSSETKRLHDLLTFLETVV